jgi:hypothetical protein
VSTQELDRLYDLLPAVYRVRDRAHGDQLRALLGVIGQELELLEADIDRLYDDWFIETCQEWVVPYIGDLLGVRGLLSIEEAPFSQRGLVANTLAYRRAKGTAAVLEQLARDVTGWPGKAIEFFDLLATNRAMNHQRRSDVSLVEVRNADQAELTGGPFERAAHLADVRHVDNARGKYNIPNVGLYLWRLQRYALEDTEAPEVTPTTPAEAGRHTFSPLRLDTQLFNVPRAEEELVQLAGEANVPGRLRRRPLHDELEARRQAIADNADIVEVYFDDSEPVFEIAVSNPSVAGSTPKRITPEEVVICNLSDAPTPPAEGWKRPPSTKRYRRRDGTFRDFDIRVGVDPVLGRLAFPAGDSYELVEVSYSYGFPGDLGGGPYARYASVAAALPDPTEVTWQVGVLESAPTGHPTLKPTLGEAIGEWDQWTAAHDRTTGVIAVLDSRTYVGDLAIEVPARSRLLIVAADWPEDEPDELGRRLRRAGRLRPVGLRPHVRGKIDVTGTAPDRDPEPGELVIDGLLVDDQFTVKPGNLGALRLAHCTLPPCSSRLVGDAGTPPGERNSGLVITLDRTITGPISLDASFARLRLGDCIVDAPNAVAIDATDVEIESSTVFGETRARTLHASNSIFTERVEVERRQTGCVRYCYLPLDSVVPRRFRCHPENEAAAARVEPAFSATTYGAPAYARLARSCPVEIREGAEDESELGAYSFLKQPQRMRSLGLRVDEYLRFGLEAGIFFAT